jgi:hypothetical protein
MDKIFRSVALFQKAEGEQSKFLVRWKRTENKPASSDGNDYWKFIVADRLNKESFRESVTREVAWELNLNRKSDFLVSNMAQLSMEYVDTDQDGLEQHVAVAFYNVHTYGRAIREQLTNDPVNRWVSAAEVCAGATSDGQMIHPRVVEWINKWSVVQSWQ